MFAKPKIQDTFFPFMFVCINRHNKLLLCNYEKEVAVGPLVVTRFEQSNELVTSVAPS